MILETSSKVTNPDDLISLTNSKPLTAKTKTVLDILNEFEASPLHRLFDQKVVATIFNCSEAKLERDRVYGAGIPFRKMLGRCHYMKKDILEFIEKHQLVTSTSQYQA